MEQTFQKKRTIAPVAGVMGVALILAGVALTRRQLISGFSDELQEKEERLEIVPSFPACSKAGDNCFDTGCCQVSGHRCFNKTTPGVARCNETCTVGAQGFTCGIINPHSVPVNESLEQNIYCFSVYTQNTGSRKKSTELDLLRGQKKFGVSIFACDSWDVFADVNVSLGGYTTIAVEDRFGEFHQIKRTDTDSWVNWGMFYQVWVKVREVGKWEQFDYTVKVDADAVFHPGRLRNWLSTKKGDSPHGVYFENCQNVQYGFFGSLEVMTHTAVTVLTKYLENCHAVFAPCANKGCDWEWGPWGEDVFVQRCMDHHYVDKMEGFDMSTDGACESDRPTDEKKNKKWHATDCSQVAGAAAHPFKKPKDYFKCMSEMTGGQYSV